MVTHLSKFTCYQFIECVILFMSAQVFLNYQQLNKLQTLLNHNIICLNLNMFKSVMIYFSVRLLVKQKRSVLHWWNQAKYVISLSADMVVGFLFSFLDKVITIIVFIGLCYRNRRHGCSHIWVKCPPETSYLQRSKVCKVSSYDLFSIEDNASTPGDVSEFNSTKCSLFLPCTFPLAVEIVKMMACYMCMSC